MEFVLRFLLIENFKMENIKIEQAYQNTFSGLTMYYRDCELSEDLVTRYKVDQIIQERGFTDVSNQAEGLAKNVRFAIASNSASNLGGINPDVAKYGFHLIASGAYFKVLDIYTIENKTQIMLMHFNEAYLEIFNSTKSNIEDKIVLVGRKSLDTKIEMQPNAILNNDEWTVRTQHPIGMSETGTFFL